MRYLNIPYENDYYQGSIDYIRNITRNYDVIQSGDIIVSSNVKESQIEYSLSYPLGINNENHKTGVGLLLEGAYYQLYFPFLKLKLESYTYQCLRNDLFEGTEMYGSNNGFEWTLLEKHNSSGSGSKEMSIQNHPVTEGIEKSYSFFRVTNSGNRLGSVSRYMWLYGIELFGEIHFSHFHTNHCWTKITTFQYLFVTFLCSK